MTTANEVSQLVAKNLRLSADLMEARAHIDNLLEQVDELEAQVREGVQDMAISDVALEVHQENAAILQDRLDDANEEVANLRQTMEDLSRVNQILYDRNFKLLATNRKIRHRYNNAVNLNSRLAAERDDLQRQVDVLAETLLGGPPRSIEAQEADV